MRIWYCDFIERAIFSDHTRPSYTIAGGIVTVGSLIASALPEFKTERVTTVRSVIEKSKDRFSTLKSEEAKFQNFTNLFEKSHISDLKLFTEKYNDLNVDFTKLVDKYEQDLIEIKRFPQLVRFGKREREKNAIKLTTDVHGTLNPNY